MKEQTITVRDRRAPGFFLVDNEILDNYKLSAGAFAMYCHLCRHAGSKGNAFLSISAFAERYSIRRSTARAQRQELFDANLIREIGKTESGSIVYELLPVQKGSGSQETQGGGSGRTQGGGSQETHKEDREKNTEKRRAAQDIPLQKISRPGASQASKGPFKKLFDSYFTDFEKLHKRKPIQATAGREAKSLSRLIEEGFTESQIRNMMDRLYFICKNPLSSNDKFLHSRGFSFTTIFAHWQDLRMNDEVTLDEIDERAAKAEVRHVG